MSVDRNPAHLYPAFSAKVQAIVSEMNAWCEKNWVGRGAMIAEGFRTTGRQQELYRQGRTTPGQIVTEKNGTSNPSNHQSCLAVDIVGSKNGNPTWDCPKAFWDYLQHCAHVHGVTSGSDWVTFKDQPHVEHPTSDKATYTAARKWKADQKLI